MPKKTKFISLPSWLEYAVDFAKYLLENPSIDAGKSGTYNERISSIGKKKIHYTKADIDEEIQISVKAATGYPEAQFDISRSGFGASSSYSLFSTEEASVNVAWASSFFDIKCNSASSSNGDSTTVGIRMSASSVNSIVTSNTSNTTLLPDSSTLIKGSFASPTQYTENTFSTNSREQNANHIMLYASGNYWAPCSITSPIMSDVVINNTNIGDFAPMGYYFDIDGNLQLDPDILASYIENILAPELELAYRQAYQHFPEPDADIKDPDITYINPFDDEEDNPPDTTETGGGGYYPPAYTDETYILDTSAFDIDYDSAVQSPYDSLKENAMLPESISSSVGKVFSQAFALIPPEFLPIYGFLMLLSVVMWFIFRR